MFAWISLLKLLGTRERDYILVLIHRIYPFAGVAFISIVLVRILILLQ